MQGPEQRLGLGAAVEEHLYRIVSEALHNVVKHARADRAAVTVTAQERSLQVTVRDDGIGFDPDAGYAGHLGLSTMAELCAPRRRRCRVGECGAGLLRTRLAHPAAGGR